MPDMREMVLMLYRATYGGQFNDASGDYAYLADNGNGLGITAYGAAVGNVGGHFTSYGGAECLVQRRWQLMQEEIMIMRVLNNVLLLTAMSGYMAKQQWYEIWWLWKYLYNSQLLLSSGIGLYGEGGGASGTQFTYGEGVYGDGQNIGVWGNADATTGLVWPVYGSNDGGARWAALAYWNGTTDYKCTGSGTVATVVKDNNNVSRIMNCPEAPEILFEDFGSATLSNGKVHIDLDPTYAKNVTINEKRALRVMITLNDQCNGVYVTNRTATGFDVIELNGGTSNASFTYEVIANRADAYDAKGNLISKNADNRFQQSVEPLMATGKATSKPSHVQTASPVKHVALQARKASTVVTPLFLHVLPKTAGVSSK